MKYLFLLLLFFRICPLSAQENDWEQQMVDSILSERYMGFQAGGGVGLMEKGVAFGFNFNYLAGKTEIGFYFLSQGHSQESESNVVTITQKIKVSSFGITAVRLFNYNQKEKRLFFILGAGMGIMDLLWSEERVVDGEIPDPEEDVTEYKSGTFGPIAVIGLGKSLGKTLDIRLESPTLFPVSTSKNVSPTLSHLLLSIGLRF